ncbi:hypothetical protein [Pseudomonas putida]
MSDTVSYLKEEYRQLAQAADMDHPPRKGGGSEPPDGGDKLEKRVSDLESSIKQIEISVAKIDTVLDGLKTNVFPNLATKADLAEKLGDVNQSVANFRTEITRVEGTLIKWFIATAFLLSGGVGAIAFGLARSIPK